MTSRLIALGLAAALLAAPAAASAQATPTQTPTRRPDVIYVPTPEEVVEAMLQVAKVTKNDVVYDLGTGDGRIPVTAAKKYGARGVGIDIDPQRIKDANENVAKNSIGDRVKIVQGDLFETDISEATVVTLYLLPVAQPEAAPEAEQGAEARHAHRLARLRHGRQEARAGTRRQRPQGLLLDDSDQVARRSFPERKRRPEPSGRLFHLSSAWRAVSRWPALEQRLAVAASRDRWRCTPRSRAWYIDTPANSPFLLST